MVGLELGDKDGKLVGALLGNEVGELLGSIVGILLGEIEGRFVGIWVPRHTPDIAPSNAKISLYVEYIKQ